MRFGGMRSYSGTAYDDLRQGDNNSFGGWYFYDHVTDGRLTEAIDTLGFSEFTLELNITQSGTTTTLNILPWTIIPVRGKK